MEAGMRYPSVVSRVQNLSGEELVEEVERLITCICMYIIIIQKHSRFSQMLNLPGSHKTEAWTRQGLAFM